MVQPSEGRSEKTTIQRFHHIVPHLFCGRGVRIHSDIELANCSQTTGMDVRPHAVQYLKFHALTGDPDDRRAAMSYVKSILPQYRAAVLLAKPSSIVEAMRSSQIAESEHKASSNSFTGMVQPQTRTAPKPSVHDDNTFLWVNSKPQSRP